MFFSSKVNPGKRDFWFLPLGGTGEIGMNMNLYGHNDQWLMVDCGVMFDKTNPQADGSNRVVSADPSFIAARRSQLVGLVVTHAHEDHIGAVPYLWQELQCPVYTTPFSAEILRRKLAETDLIHQVPIIEVQSGDTTNIGHFEVQWMNITHSIPEPNALVISAGDSKVFHTADWKIDADPVLGKPFDKYQFKALADQNITAMVCDSTNATVAGHSISEGDCYDGLLPLIKKAEGRVIVACFGSNLARLITLCKIALKTGRYGAVYGRSMRNMYSAARRTGIWPDNLSLADGRHLGYLPRNEVLGIATGSQGEFGAALRRMANGTFRDLELEPGDTVIFSSKVIPGNEKDVASLVEQLRNRGVDVIESADVDGAPIHASGHPCQDELRELYRLVQPKIALPVHGTPIHINANAAIAKEIGIPTQMRGENGDLYKLSPLPTLKRKAVKVGRITHDRD